MGAVDSATRLLLLQVAERVMVEEGYAAVTSRRIAAEASVKSPLIHYYFRSMDDLFVAMIRRIAAGNLDLQARALGSEQPLHALWRLANHPAAVALNTEFAALANHRKVVRATIAEYGEIFRAQQLEVVSRLFERYRITADVVTPAAFVVMLQAVGRNVGQERALGITSGHADTIAFIEQLLDRTEGPDPRARASRTTRSRSA